MSDDLGAQIMAAADGIEGSLGSVAPDPSLSLAAEGDDPLVLQLVYSLLLWESNHETAAKSLAAIREQVCNLNELRVCAPDEVSAMLPREQTKRDERADRICTALNDIFLREHALSLSNLNAMPKREARQYLDGIEGLPQFVCARVMLVSLGGHAFPVDDRLVSALHGLGAIESAKEPAADLGAKLERAVRAADAGRVYGLLELHAGAEKPGRGKKKATPRRSKTAATGGQGGKNA